MIDQADLNRVINVVKEKGDFPTTCDLAEDLKLDEEYIKKIVEHAVRTGLLRAFIRTKPLVDGTPTNITHNRLCQTKRRRWSSK